MAFKPTCDVRNIHVSFKYISQWWSNIPDISSKGVSSVLMFSVLGPGFRSPGSTSGWGHCIVFLGKAFNSHCPSPHPLPGVWMGSGKLFRKPNKFWGNHLRWTSIPSRGIRNTPNRFMLQKTGYGFEGFTFNLTAVIWSFMLIKSCLLSLSIRFSNKSLGISASLACIISSPSNNSVKKFFFFQLEKLLALILTGI